MKHGSLIRRGSLIAGLAAAALVLGACSPGGAPTEQGGGGGDAGSKDPIKVTIGAVFTTATVPIWIAESEGFFEDNGLEVTITQSPNFAASAPSLLNGQMHFANAATSPAITAIGEGMPLQMIAGVSADQQEGEDAANQVLVPEGSTITRPKDLEGHTIATNAIGSGPYIGVMANYLEDGGDPAKINWIVMNLNEQIPALEKGQIDAGMFSEPFTAQARAAGFVPAFDSYHADGIDLLPYGFTDAVLLASKDYIAKNPDAVERMRTAMIEANDFATANEEAVRAILVEKAGLDPAVSDDVNLPGWIGEIEPKGVQAMIDAMTKVGLLKKPLKAEDIIWVP